jgi:hypothetical protein
LQCPEAKGAVKSILSPSTKIDFGMSQTEGFAEDSFVLRSLEDLGVAKEDKTHHAIIKDVAGVVFIGNFVFSFQA